MTLVLPFVRARCGSRVSVERAETGEKDVSCCLRHETSSSPGQFDLDLDLASSSVASAFHSRLLASPLDVCTGDWRFGIRHPHSHHDLHQHEKQLRA